MIYLRAKLLAMECQTAVRFPEEALLITTKSRFLSLETNIHPHSMSTGDSSPRMKRQQREADQLHLVRHPGKSRHEPETNLLRSLRLFLL